MLTQAVAECLCRQTHCRKDAWPKRYVSLTCNHIPQARSIEAHSAMTFTSTVFKHIRRSAGAILWTGSKLYGAVTPNRIEARGHASPKEKIQRRAFTKPDRFHNLQRQLNARVYLCLLANAQSPFLPMLNLIETKNNH